MRQTASFLVVCALLLVIVCQFAAAQMTVRGTITGLVTDATGAVVPGVKVIAKNTATGVLAETVSSSSGNYVIPNLQVGTYEVSVSSTGFKSWSRSGILLSVGESARVDVTLEVGQVTEQVTVSGAAPLLKTETTEVSATMESKLVGDMPVPMSSSWGMRSVFSVMLMMPQVKSNDGQGAWDDFIVGGGQGFAWQVVVDGASIETGFRNNIGVFNRLAPVLDAVEEAHVDTAAFKAEQTHTSGGNMVLTTKSGTNEFHGSAFDYYASQVFSANSWGANRIGSPKAIFHKNEFGINAGGPIFIPKIYNGKNRTFFYFGYEGSRQPSTSAAGLLTVATAAMKQGDFSDWKKANGTLIPVYDPTTTQSNPAGGYTRQVFSGNLIPASRITQIAKNITKYMPDPNRSTASVLAQYGAMVSNLQTSGTAPAKAINNAETMKFDHNFGVKNRLSLTYTRNVSYTDSAYDHDTSDWNNWGPRLPFPLTGRTYYRGSTYYGNVFRMNDTHLITPTLINTFTFGYHRLYHEEHDVTAYLKGNNDWCQLVGALSNNSGCSNAMLSVSFSTDSFYSWDATKDTDEFHNVYNAGDNISWIKGSHSFKFGYNYQMIQTNRHIWNSKAGQVSFSRLETAVPGDNSGNSGSSFASFMLGAVDSGNLSTGYALGLRYPSHSFFVQDDWKITPRLTANLGFRLEVNPAYYDKYDQQSYFDPTLPNPAASGFPGAVRYLGFGTGRENKRTWYDGQKGYGPRLGLAYQFTKDTVIRAGFGVFHSNYKQFGGNDGFAVLPVWSSTNSGITPAFYWNEGWPYFPSPPYIKPEYNAGGSFPNYYFVDQISRPPMTSSWNFAVSRMLPANLVLDLTYAGSRGTHLASNRTNRNPVDPKYAYLGSTLNKLITDPAVVALGFKPPFANFSTLLGTRATLAQALRPFPQYTSLGGGSWTEYDGNSTYNALIAKLTKRFSHGLSMLTSYIWSKTLTDADMELPEVGVGSGIGFGAAQNSLNKRLEKSYSALDIPHQFKMAFSYDLPFGKGRSYLQSGPLRYILGEWTFSSYTLAQSGFPLGVVDNAYSNYLLQGTPRPDVASLDWRTPVAGTGSFDPIANLWLDSSKFIRRTNPAVNPFGNAPRLNGASRSARIVRVHSTLMRGFTVKEKIKAEFRWEIYDLFNNKVWTVPTLDLSSDSFGRVGGASGSRSMQMALRLIW
jgi:hypothetical protein